MQETLNKIIELLTEIKDTMPKKNRKIKKFEDYAFSYPITENRLDPNKMLYTTPELYELYKDTGYSATIINRALRKSNIIKNHRTIKNKRMCLNTSYVN
jgi:arginine/lysine/ornithine decarboxylase